MLIVSFIVIIFVTAIVLIATLTGHKDNDIHKSDVPVEFPTDIPHIIPDYELPEPPKVLPDNLADLLKDVDPGLVEQKTKEIENSIKGTGRYYYAEALHKSFLFYQAQRSGKLPYQVLAWRTDSCFECKGPGGEDLSGGYYEAANTMKWGFPKAFTLTQLAWNIVEYGDAMKSVNELNEAMEALKWGTDYLINAHPEPLKFVGQFGRSTIDFEYFGPPEEYEKWARGPKVATYITPENRSTEILCETAAAMSAAAIVFKTTNPEYSALLIEHAKQLYAFGRDYPGTFNTSTDEGFKEQFKWYPSTSYTDELVWAAVWLYKATGDEFFLKEAETNYALHITYSGVEYSWDDKAPGIHILLAAITNKDQYHLQAIDFFKKWLPGKDRSIKHTPKGLGYFYHWGSNRYAANTSFLCFTYAKTIKNKSPEFSASLIEYAEFQLNYILGDGGRSWMVGFGNKSPLLPYHKSSYNAYIDFPLRGQLGNLEIGGDFLMSRTPNRFIAYGALVGGPLENDDYVDNRENYEYTEVTQDYNAAFTGALAALVEIHGGKPFSHCNLDFGWDHPNAEKEKRAVWPDDDCYHKCCA